MEADIDGRRAVQHTWELARCHRAAGSSGYQQAAAYAAQYLTAHGLATTVERYPIDGRRHYWDFIPRAAWQVSSASLQVTSPQPLSLADWSQTPVCLYFGSCGTAAGGITTDLVDAGRGQSAGDFDGRDVAGRVVLCSGPPLQAYDLAVRQRGAAGVVSDHMVWESAAIGRTAAHLPDLVSYGSVDIPPDEWSSGGFIFAISHRTGMRLRQLLGEGPVSVHAEITGGPYAGEMEVVTAHLPGTTDEDLLLLAHLCHPQPGAHDNASGIALVLELARALAARARQNPPGRGLRIVLGPELFGTVAYLAHHAAELPRLRAGLNLDMVGADQEKIRGALALDATPWSMPHFANDLLAFLLADLQVGRRPLRWYERDFFGGSDHLVLIDSAVGVPTIGLGHSSDLYYHSQYDLPENMDPDTFTQVGAAAGAWLSLLSSPPPGAGQALLPELQSRAIGRLLQAAQRGLAPAVAPRGTVSVQESAKAADSGLPTSRTHLERIAWRESQGLATLRDFFPDLDAAALDRAQADLAAVAAALAPLLPPGRTVDAAGAERRYRRLFTGPLVNPLFARSRFLTQLPPPRQPFYAHLRRENPFIWLQIGEAVSLMSGAATLAEIHDAVSHAVGPWPYAVLDHLVTDLAAAGMIRLEA